MKDITVIIPTFGRPHRMADLVKNIHENTTVPHKILFAVEPDDIATQEAITAAGEKFIISDTPGTHTGALNTAYKHVEDSYMLFGNDDFNFHPQWAEKALELMHDPIKVVGINDGSGSSRCNTFFLVDKSYIDEQSGVIDTPGVIFYPGYNHNYADQEFWETAEKRKVYAAAQDSIVEHMHPGYGKAPKDETYHKSDRTAEADKDTFNSRLHLWRS